MPKLLLFAATIALSGSAAVAADKRQLDSHEHGLTILNVAAEDGTVVLELEGPGMNYVGFEHPPRTAEQQAAVSAAVKALQNGADLFQFNAAADCRLARAASEHVSGDDDEEHAADENHDEDDDTGHSEFRARYRFDCAQPTKLRDLRVNLFEDFPLNDEVEVSFIGDGFQTFKELNRDDRMVKLSK